MSSNSNFRIQSKQLFLTIPQIDKSITKELAMERLKSHFNGKLNCLMVAHEKHKDEGDHLHIYINFIKTFQTIKKDYFDFIADKHPNIQPVKNRLHVIKYIMKDGDYITYNLDPEQYIKEVDNHEVRKSKGAFQELVEDIKEGVQYKQLRSKHAALFVKYGRHIEEYLKKEKYLKDEEEVNKYYDNLYDKIVWKEWQQKVLDIIEDNKVDNRTINWIYDKQGNNGKSTIANYLEIYKNAYIITGGKQADIYRHYDNNRIVIYDLPRDYTEGNDSIYSTMECFKNGYILDTKYEGQKKRFIPPHIFVFSNSMPNIDKLSKDRWNIINLDDISNKHEINEEVIEDNMQKIVKNMEEIKAQSKEHIKEIVSLGLEHNKVYYGRYRYNQYTSKLWDNYLFEWLPIQ